MLISSFPTFLEVLNKFLEVFRTYLKSSTIGSSYIPCFTPIWLDLSWFWLRNWTVESCEPVNQRLGKLVSTNGCDGHQAPKYRKWFKAISLSISLLGVFFSAEGPQDINTFGKMPQEVRPTHTEGSQDEDLEKKQ
jgi:hypothetical protein